MLQNNPKLKALIVSLWNTFWSGGIANPITAIEQITYLLFMKKLDENDLNNQSDEEFTGEPYISKFDGIFYATKQDQENKQNGIDKQKLRWSAFKRLPSEEMLQLVQTKVLRHCMRLFPKKV